MPTLRIFISSPGDVNEERSKAAQVIQSLQQRFDQGSLLTLMWENFALPSTESFQAGIDRILAKDDPVDIAVFILWSRIGHPLKADGKIYLSGTEREFEQMLEAFVQSGRQKPLILTYFREDEAGFSVKLDTTKRSDEEIRELLDQKRAAKEFVQKHFRTEEGFFKGAYCVYEEPTEFARRFDIHLTHAVESLLGMDPSVRLWQEEPYRRLDIFDIKHAPIFCGRDEEIYKVSQQLRDQRKAGCSFVCIVGASGSGKSSLARAGVAAVLSERSFEDGLKEWRPTILIPGHAQCNRFEALAFCIAEAIPELAADTEGVKRVAKHFEGRNPSAACMPIEFAHRSAETALGAPFRVLLVLDQMEELWTDREFTTDQREAFLQAIEALARLGFIDVLATLRSDFYAQAQLSEAFMRMKTDHAHFDLTQPKSPALQQMIVRPAHRVGLHFENLPLRGSLDQRIIEDAGRDHDALPLLQYALAELYKHRDEERHLLTFAAYDAIGGVKGALTQRASEIFASLSQEAQASFHELLPLLVSVDTLTSRTLPYAAASRCRNWRIS